MHFFYRFVLEVWNILLDSSFYILVGICIGGILKVMMNPNTVIRHLGRGRYLSVIKAALFGIPLPLCSCGVLPAAATIRKQGANRGATTAFLISTPESGVDSITVSWALLDPLMTVVRPVAAFCSAMVAGMMENLFFWEKEQRELVVDRRCPVDGCCDGVDCPDEIHKHHHTFLEKIRAGMRFAYTSVWGDIAVWFFAGVLLAALISVLVSESFMSRFLGGGFSSMLIMLVVGIPLYICATASTPVAAALIMKGVSPGTALVFLLVGPATNITSLSVLTGLLGRKSTALYLVVLSFVAVIAGLLLDQLYLVTGIVPKAMIGSAGEIVPLWLKIISVFFLLLISVKPLYSWLLSKVRKPPQQTVFMSGFPDLQGMGRKDNAHDHDHCSCGHHH